MVLVFKFPALVLIPAGLLNDFLLRHGMNGTIGEFIGLFFQGAFYMAFLAKPACKLCAILSWKSRVRIKELRIADRK